MAQIKFRKEEQLVPVCPKCNGVLAGNNSLAYPYTCYYCKGTWEATFTNPMDYIFHSEK